jgi:hypothetical protein
MKKLIAIFSAIFFIMSTSARADLGIGISANFASIDTEGSETELTGDLEKTTATHSNDVTIPEVFAEAVADNGFAVGLAYIPARKLGSKSRTDTTPTADDETGDAGVYTAKAQVNNVIQIYTDIPIGPIYAKLGATRATLKTQEKSPQSTSYEDSDVTGLTYGIGYKNDLPIIANGYFKVEYTHTSFDEYSDIDSAGDTKVVADTEIDSLRISLGTKF